MLVKAKVTPALAVVLVAALALSGCQLFGKKKTGDTTYVEQPVEQLYSVGAERLDAHRWAEAITYFKEVERQHPYSEWSRRAILMEAYAHYEANEYNDAIDDSQRFIELYPGNGSVVYAYYLKAQCYFEQILDVGRDQAATESALTSEREVARRFPKSEYAADARIKIDMINDQLAGKEMTIGRYYLRQGDMLAAIGRFKTVIDKYQTTSHTPEALERLVEAYLTLGLIQEAKENAAVLGYNYPGDYWYSAAYQLMTDKGLRPAITPKRRRGLFNGINQFFGPSDTGPVAAAPPPLSPLVQPDTSATPAAGQASTTESTSSDQTPPPPKKKHHWWDPLHLAH